ncbi:hypothetical protein [uncultured Hymenobacter sp.]|uniref:hypothetical protein n=1 Tax=uncultured Hymenobacter sp. TaxID=170016 RepID=UPI0035CB7FB3
MDQELYGALLEVSKNIPVIDANRQYWFIRTNGGLFYDDFWHSSAVGIGYNLLTLDMLSEAGKTTNPTGYLNSAVEQYYTGHKQPGRVIGLMLRFLYEMKEGDIVVMPSGSGVVAFGEVTGDPPFELEGEGPWSDIDRERDRHVPFRKRRSVKWLMRASREKLDSNLYGAFVAPQALSKLNDYGDFIDRELHAIYTKGGETHVRLDIGSKGGIDGDDYFDMGHALLSLCRDFREEHGLASDAKRIDVRSNVQSPGLLEFIGANPLLMAWLASVITVGLFGGHAKSEKLGISIGTDGLIKSVQNYLDARSRRITLEQILAEKLQLMDASVSADLLRTLTAVTPATPAPQAPLSPPQIPPTTA